MTSYFVHISWFFSFLMGGGGGLDLDIIGSEMHSGCLVCVICNFSFVFIQTLHNDCWHIEDVHLLFCLHFVIFFLILEGYCS